MAFEIFDSTYVNLQNGIERAAKKQAVIAQNIANINNPSYEPLEFDEVLNKAVKRADKHIVLENELAALSQNTFDHGSYVKLLAEKLSVIRTVVTQGRK